MANTRINQIAKEAKVSNKEVIAKLAELGIEVEDEKAEIDEEDAQLVLDLLKDDLTFKDWQHLAEINNKKTNLFLFEFVVFNDFD